MSGRGTDLPNRLGVIFEKSEIESRDGLYEAVGILV